MLKEFAKCLLSESNLGRVDFFFRRKSKGLFKGLPFNKQRYRYRIFADILYHFPLQAIVETGTFRGATTTLFAVTTLPVYTAEIHPRYFRFAKLRFRYSPYNVTLYHGDSRIFLRTLSENNSVSKEHVFFYLDAHWQDDLPLYQEVEIIMANWARPIIMIDDFKVPGTDYIYDQYGQEKALELDYIAPLLSKHNLAVFFPAATASQETGMKRGCVVLCREQTGETIEANIKTLNRFEFSNRC